MSKTSKIYIAFTLFIVILTIGIILKVGNIPERLEDMQGVVADSRETSPDIHGSCVFAVQEWHKSPLYKYCIPLSGEWASTLQYVPTPFDVVEYVSDTIEVVFYTLTAEPTEKPNISTPAPTSTPAPQATGTPEPTAEPTAEPVKECKNPNAGRDGTPLECNAGGGQEKHNK